MTQNPAHDAIYKAVSDHTSSQIVTLLEGMNKPWGERTNEEHTVRSALIHRYEDLTSGKEVDALMDRLDEAA